ncbi:MAG: helix-turn-helix transcriptional regulator [Alphaproteobacteria bacterium]|nr:helix-turn-helix transcriptional regulator [Alphaproteobacteria bacterium]
MSRARKAGAAEDAPMVAEPRVLASLGGVIRKARREAGMTLQDLAGRSDLSISFLSQVERNLLSPSVSALKRIADVLRIPAGSLMFGTETRSGMAGVGLVRAGSRKRVVFPDSKIVYEMLTPDMRRRMSVLFLTAPPRAESGPVFAHEGEDAVILLKGRLLVEIGGVWHALGKGDSLYFNSELPHRWRNDTDSEAEVIWISTPPSF